MSQVFPTSLAVKSTNAALAEGSYWFGLTCIAAAFAGILSVALARPGFTAWAVFPALAVIAGGGTILYFLDRVRVVVVALVFIVQVAGMTWYVHTVFVYQNSVPSDPQANSDTLFISLATTAMVMFGVTAGRVLPGISSVVGAFVVAESIVVACAFMTGHPVVVDLTATGLFAVLVLVLALLRVSRRRSRALQPAFEHAGQVNTAAMERERADSRVSALVHDTVLNELAVVSTRAPGTVPGAVRDRIAASLAVIVGENAQSGGTIDIAQSLGSELAQAVDEARASGLVITVEGDLGASAGLRLPVAQALGLAVRQCLGNVLAHSGVDAAELAVIAGDVTLTVMIVDSGAGFVEAEVGGDRLGIRNSVRGRIESIGGSVQLWTTPGVGTTVSLTVPQ